MKNLLKLSIGVLAILAIASCKPDPTPPPTPQELQLEKLVGVNGSKTWNSQNVTFDGSEDRTDDWNGFSLTLSSSGTDPLGTHNYSTTNAVTPGPWPASGTWNFGGTAENPNINQAIRNDGLVVSISVTESNLTLTFTYDENAVGGRTESVNGEYVFNMTSTP